MNKIESTVRILVIELAGRRFFCGMDERRIVFFKKIVLLLLPSRSTEYNTGITVYRDNKEFTTGFPTTTTGHVEQYELVGLEEIFSESKVPVVTWNSIEKLKADWFENKLLHGRFVIFENPPSKKYLAHF